MELNQVSAERLIDACTLLVDQKVASAKTFGISPFSDLGNWDAWGQSSNDAVNLTPRTKGYLLAYVLLSGGSIPMVGLRLADAWFRPDIWVMGALVKFGMFEARDDEGRFVLTPAGWTALAELMER